VGNVGRREMSSLSVVWDSREGKESFGDRERGQCMTRERSLVSSKGGVASLFLFLKDEQGYSFFAREIGLGFSLLKMSRVFFMCFL
jgi:hypothetical protein